jgi:uncharacterized protein (DUF4415 family)
MKKKMTTKQSASSRLATRWRKNEKRTTGNSVRVVTSDELQNDPKLRARIERELAGLAKRGLIDTSDAPVLAWKNPIRGLDAWLKVARAGRLYKPVKQAVSMRLDADVVAWLKQSGPGYQTRANQILREKMLGELSR